MEIFGRLAASTHLPKHFDDLSLRGENITEFSANFFSGLTFSSVWISQIPNLRSIHPKAFSGNGAERSIQVLEIEKANFASCTEKETRDIFRAFSTLLNVRVLRIWSSGIPLIPNSAFVPENGELMHNLRYLSLDFDRREHKNGIRSVGSYAFSGAPNLKELGLSKSFIEYFHSFAFAFNETRNQSLQVHIGRNPFNDETGLAPDAFSGAQGPLNIKYEVDSFAASDPANDPSFQYFPENVFRPFLEENSGNSLLIDYFNVDIWCDGRVRWMFSDDGVLRPRVQSGLRVKRIEGNTIVSEEQSAQCKAESTFESLPNCLIFPLPSLIHCGGQHGFDVYKEFNRLFGLGMAPNISKLIFSTKGVHELGNGTFGKFQFKQVHLTGK
jgi:hypothetical protein